MLRSIVSQNKQEKNKLYYGDNYEVLQRYVRDESVDLVYLDPPFNSRQDYNVLFAEKDGSKSSSQIHAFEDTWEWNLDAERSYQHIVETIGGRIADAMRAFRTFLGNSDMMAYLAMMAPRLVELKRVFKETGSIYLHCDPTASHYLKILMDAVFGPQNFRTEVIWKRTSSHGNVSVGFGDVTDTILYYRRGERPIWNQVHVPYSDDYIKSHFGQTDSDGRRYTTSDLRNPGVRPNLHYEYRDTSHTPMAGQSLEKEWNNTTGKAVSFFQRILTDESGLSDILTSSPEKKSRICGKIFRPSTLKPRNV
jgi:site-specific DNA-methyltransferase (adenine-specific)